MPARFVAIFLVASAACAPATARQPHFAGVAEPQPQAHHTKISTGAAVGIAALSAAVAGFAGVLFFVVPQHAG